VVKRAETTAPRNRAAKSDPFVMMCNAAEVTPAAFV
jgi:hypothetical protein